jgi:putative transposase
MRDAWREARPDWVKECAPNSLVVSVFDLDEAYKRFFDIQRQGEKFTKKTRERAARQGRKLTDYDMKGHPQFKSKHKAKMSFGLQCDKLSFYANGVVLTKIGRVKYQTDAPIELGSLVMKSKIKNPRAFFISGKWILSFSLETQVDKPQLTDKCVGIDLGLATLATVSCGGEITKIKNINKTAKVKKIEKQLRRTQRTASKRQKRSKNQDKAYDEVRRLQARLRNIRRDYTHKATHSVVSMLPRAICLEDLNVRGMMKNRHLSKAIASANWSEFGRQIEYKSAKQDTKVVYANRFEPSSKRCSVCGAIKHNLKLKDRVYRCNSCGAVIDRDDNAAANLERLAESA